MREMSDLEKEVRGMAGYLHIYVAEDAFAAEFRIEEYAGITEQVKAATLEDVLSIVKFRIKHKQQLNAVEKQCRTMMNELRGKNFTEAEAQLDAMRVMVSRMQAENEGAEDG